MMYFVLGIHSLTLLWG